MEHFWLLWLPKLASFSIQGFSMRGVIATAFRKCNMNPMSEQQGQLLLIHLWDTYHVADILFWLNSSGPLRVKEIISSNFRKIQD